MDFLTVVGPDGETARHEVRAAALRVGRSSGNDLVLKDLNVSRVHAEIVKRPEGYYVLDAGGKNGTYVNDRRVCEPTLLRPGDRVRVGTTTLILNGSSSSPVEFTDRPLMPGLGTTILPAGDVRTPMPDDIPLLLEGGRPTLLGSPAAGPAVDEMVVTPSPSGALPLEVSITVAANQELVFHRPLPEILETIMDLARRAVPFERGLLMLLENGQLVPEVMRVPPDETGRTISISRTITDRVVHNKESVLTSDAQIDERFRQGHSVEAQHLRSVMCVPLWNNREVIGLIYVDNRHRAGLFNESNLRLLTHLANVAAVKIENARLFEVSVAAEMMRRELQTAAEIQNHLLPAGSPQVSGYLLCGASTPCGAVGGDYFDYIELPDGRCAFGLGDVAGKGMPAALLMCFFQASLRALVELDLQAAETLTRLNRLLCARLPANRFVTFFYGILDPATHGLTYVNAGQTPPCLLHADGSTERLDGTGFALGLFPKSVYEPRTIPFRIGDLLVCYSDGVTEARNSDEEDFGEGRLVATVHATREASLPDVVRSITSEVERHCGEARPQDDMTLLAVRRTD
jgi:sigma-B regulation protein RsbU (phosphoserine phosphatase)